MPRKEKQFPLSTTGGRLQYLCKQKEIGRKELYYTLLSEKAKSSSDSNINRTVINWFNETTKLNFEQIRKACTLLECSADYLLCMENTYQQNKKSGRAV